MSEEPRYVLEVSQKQARIIDEAVDLYSRIGMGQLSELLYYFPARFNGGQRTEKFSQNRDEAEHLLVRIKELIGNLPSGHHYHSIADPDINDAFRVAYDIRQVVRHFLAWERVPGGGYNRDFDEPMRLSQLDLPIFKRKE